jgi:hypothetical protein
MTVAALLLTTFLAGPASAAKWAGGCPKVVQRLVRVGTGYAGPYAISRYFEHVGHDLTFYLKDTDVTRTGGFSTAPGGNTLQVTFTPFLGTPIALPPVQVTATTSSTLTITVPDSRPIIGRLLVGPARFKVTRGTTVLFEAYTQLILPPMNDVQALMTAGTDVEVLATLQKGSRLWIPLDFNGFGTGGEALPACPTELTPVTPFAVDFNMRKGDDQAFPYISLGELKKNRLYLGDYLMFGLNMYGNKLQTKLDVRPGKERSIVLCGLNDALQLVVMFGLKNKALGSKSELVDRVRDGSPVTVKIENISLDPDILDALQQADYDSAHLKCYPEEPTPTPTP